jgi:hypothetical protein
MISQRIVEIRCIEQVVASGHVSRVHLRSD